VHKLNIEGVWTDKSLVRTAFLESSLSIACPDIAISYDRIGIPKPSLSLMCPNIPQPCPDMISRYFNLGTMSGHYGCHVWTLQSRLDSLGSLHTYIFLSLPHEIPSTPIYINGFGVCERVSLPHEVPSTLIYISGFGVCEKESERETKKEEK
jgi:hypothetical protein